MKTHLIILSLAVLHVSHATVVRSPLQELNLLVGSIFSRAMCTPEGIHAVGGSMIITRRDDISLNTMR